MRFFSKTKGGWCKYEYKMNEPFICDPQQSTYDQVIEYLHSIYVSMGVGKVRHNHLFRAIVWRCITGEDCTRQQSLLPRQYGIIQEYVNALTWKRICSKNQPEISREEVWICLWNIRLWLWNIRPPSIWNSKYCPKWMWFLQAVFFRQANSC